MNTESLSTELRAIMKMVIMYENKYLQAAALELIPVNRFHRHVYTLLRRLRIEKKLFSPHVCSVYWENLFIKQLITWFKEEFFKWFEPPVCTKCKITTSFLKLSYIGSDSQISSVEFYNCSKCQSVFSFPRYIDAYKLLLTRTGRCSEWAQVFCLMCRSLGWRTRYVLDLNDHVWIEIYSELEKRWIHCDPAEGVFDEPLMYEMKWGRELTAVVGIGSDDIQDVTWRYASDHIAVQSRRSQELNNALLENILHLRQILQCNLPAARKKYLVMSVIKELVELMIEPLPEHNKVHLIEPSEAALQFQYEAVSLPVSPYIWTLEDSEVVKKEINILYYCSLNYYSRNIEEKDIFKVGWESCIYQCKNITRKTVDWKMVCIAREEGSSVGTITWSISTEGTHLAVDKISFSCQVFTKTSGLIKWELSNYEKSICVFNRVTYETSVLTGSRTIFITANLLGGEGDVGWQYAQLCQQALFDEQLPLHIRVTFTNV